MYNLSVLRAIQMRRSAREMISDSRANISHSVLMSYFYHSCVPSVPIPGKASCDVGRVSIDVGTDSVFSLRANKMVEAHMMASGNSSTGNSSKIKEESALR